MATIAISPAGCLWIEEHVRARDLELVKVLGTENPADMPTKFVEHPARAKKINNTNIAFETGRAESAQKIDVTRCMMRFDKHPVAPTP